jgi:hypothetical protein
MGRLGGMEPFTPDGCRRRRGRAGSAKRPHETNQESRCHYGRLAPGAVLVLLALVGVVGCAVFPTHPAGGPGPPGSASLTNGTKTRTASSTVGQGSGGWVVFDGSTSSVASTGGSFLGWLDPRTDRTGQGRRILTGFSLRAGR